MTIAERRAALQQIAEELYHSVCPLRRSATQPVPGEGKVNAKVVFIGEAPGAKEDQLGRPFVGSAGKVLDKMLSQIDLKLADVFITSVEKFRPPHNRDPKLIELRACWPYLERQINIIRPKIIVTLGRHAWRQLWNAEQDQSAKAPSLSQAHGQPWFSPSGRIYFPVHHPAAIFYGLPQQILVADFRQLGKLLSGMAKRTY